MYIAGTPDLQVTVDEPAVLVEALYVREVAGLQPEIEPEIPPLDPSVDTWPVWARRRPVLDPGVPTRLPAVSDHHDAGVQWARWWRQMLDSPPSAERDLHPPRFDEFAQSPALRRLLMIHHATAQAWAEASMADPRVKRDHSAPRAGLMQLIRHIEAERGVSRRPMHMRVTVIPVRTEHAWQLAPDHILLTRHLIADTDNALDWLRPRILALA